MTANILVVFGFERSNLSFGKVDRNEVIAQLASLTATDAGSLVDLDLISSSEFVSASIAEGSPRDPEGKKISIKVEVSPGLPLGRFSGSVTARSSIDSLPDAILRISGTIIGPVEISPESVRFVLMKNAGNSLVPEFHKVRIVNHESERTLNVLSARDPEEKMVIELKTIVAGKEFELNIRPRSIESVAGSVNGTIVIATDNPNQPELYLTYSVVPKI